MHSYTDAVFFKEVHMNFETEIKMIKTVEKLRVIKMSFKLLNKPKSIKFVCGLN